jgi:hypothetical protein
VGKGECRAEGRYVCDHGEVVCDAAEKERSLEICDGLDNDCDGLVDFSTVDERPQAACECKRVPLLARQARSETDDPPDPCGHPVCGIDAARETSSMSLCVSSCARPDYWAQCVYENVDLDRFDADHEGTGILEVTFCTDAPVRSALQLQYGEYPMRKYFDLVTTEASAPDGLPAGCYRKLLFPSDAQCPTFDDAVPDDPSLALLPQECRTGGCTNGRWAERASTCKFEYDDRPLWLAAVWCSGTTAASIALRVTWYSPGCACPKDGDCLTGICDEDIRIQDPRCPEDTPVCAGICVPTESSPYAFRRRGPSATHGEGLVRDDAREEGRAHEIATVLGLPPRTREAHQGSTLCAAAAPSKR